MPKSELTFSKTTHKERAIRIFTVTLNVIPNQASQWLSCYELECLKLGDQMHMNEPHPTIYHRFGCTLIPHFENQ